MGLQRAYAEGACPPAGVRRGGPDPSARVRRPYRVLGERECPVPGEPEALGGLRVALRGGRGLLLGRSPAAAMKLPFRPRVSITPSASSAR